MTTRSRLLFCFVLLGIVLGSVENTDASPITWTYEGAVLAAFTPPVTPVTFTVTADPAGNLIANSPFHPDFMGAYFATVHATMVGVGYTVDSALEVNGDPLFPSITFRGFTALREFSESTDQGFFLEGGFQSPIAYVFQPDLGNGLSPALLMPFPRFDLALFVAPTDVGFPVPSRVNVSGHVVPEQTSGTLMALGFGAAALAKGCDERVGRYGQEAE